MLHVRGCVTFNVLFQSDGRIIGEFECLVKRDQQGGAFQEQKLVMPPSIWRNLWLCFRFLLPKSGQFNSIFLSARVFDGNWKQQLVKTEYFIITQLFTTEALKSVRCFSFWIELQTKFLTVSTDYFPHISSSHSETWNPWFSPRFDQLLWILKSGLSLLNAFTYPYRMISSASLWLCAFPPVPLPRVDFRFKLLLEFLYSRRCFLSVSHLSKTLNCVECIAFSRINMRVSSWMNW